MSSTGLPLLFNASGPIATPPATILQALLAYVAAQSPGYTANLPGSLIDDVSGTDVGALVIADQARVDAVNNVSPYTANPYVLALLGAQFGLPQGSLSNGNALLNVSGTPGFVIAPGWLFGDGTNQYAAPEGGVIPTGGTLTGLYVVATNSNVFPIPPNSITQSVTSVPSPYTLTITNPTAGNAAEAAETVESYRARLNQAQQFQIQGAQSVLKTLLLAVPGVSSRLVSVIPNGSNWEVICGGGDPYQVAGAIYKGVSNVGGLVGSATSARNVNVSLYDAPNTYNVVYVNPPQQEVTVAVTWNTTLPNFTSTVAVNQFIVQAVQAYINSISVGQPINLMVMTEQVQNAVAPVLAAANLTTLSFVVKYSGVVQSPTAGTSIIPAPDAETYLYASATDVTSAQG